MIASSLLARISTRARSRRARRSSTVTGVAWSRIDLRAAIAGGSSAEPCAGVAAAVRGDRAVVAAAVADRFRKSRRVVMVGSGRRDARESLPWHPAAVVRMAPRPSSSQRGDRGLRRGAPYAGHLSASVSPCQAFPHRVSGQCLFPFPGTARIVVVRPLRGGDSDAVNAQEAGPSQAVVGTVRSEVPFSEDLCAWLNEVNANRLRIGYAYWRDDEIRYAIEDIAAPLTTEHVLDALAVASGTVPVLAREAGLWLPAPLVMA